VILTGGFSKMDGIRELAIATFGSIPVRLARPIEMDGLFDNLRTAEYSTAIGLVMYATFSYTPYEIDVNKRVRHSNEAATEKININFSDDLEIPIAELKNKVSSEKMVSIDSSKEKKSDEAGAINKFWNWATQLF